jgi:hypothetical protein
MKFWTRLSETYLTDLMALGITPRSSIKESRTDEVSIENASVLSSSVTTEVPLTSDHDQTNILDYPLIQRDEGFGAVSNQVRNWWKSLDSTVTIENVLRVLREDVRVVTITGNCQLRCWASFWKPILCSIFGKQSISACFSCPA